MNRAYLYMVFCISLLCCERDDVCDAVILSTPHLIIRFYSIVDTKTPTAVTNLYVTGEGKEAPLDAYKPSSTDSISVPLKIFDNKTIFKLIRDYKGSPEDNTDTLEVSYTVDERFLYRGCGFIALYKNLKIKIPSDDNNWIKAVEITNADVINELRAQVKIFY